jgi:hypothetical protein
MHPEVSRQFFEDGTKLITGNHDLLVDRGWLVLSASYPSLIIAVKHRATSKVRVFRFICDNWNDLPPALSLIDGETGQELPGSLWPTDNASHWHGSGWSPAPGINTDKPFMCMVGIREYHTHQSHVDDSWDNYKNQPGFDLPGIVVRVTEVFQKSNV